MQPRLILVQVWIIIASYLTQLRLSPVAQRYMLCMALVVLTILGLYLSVQFNFSRPVFSVLSLLNKVPFGEPWP